MVLALSSCLPINVAMETSKSSMQVECMELKFGLWSMFIVLRDTPHDTSDIKSEL